MPAEAVMLSLVSPRDEELCQGRPDYRPFLEAAVRYGAMGKALVSTQGQLEAESRARLELEGQRGALNLHCEQLVACERRALEEAAARDRRAAEEATATAVRCYRESEAFPRDVRAYMAEHAEESYQALKTTRAGKDATFDPVAWGLPAELMDPEPLATPATSPGASGIGVATGADLFSGLTLGLGGAVDTALDQIHIPLGMADFSQAADPEACDS
nr:tubby-related protein 1-like isoform X1 [Ipomoea batatas]